MRASLGPRRAAAAAFIVLVVAFAIFVAAPVRGDSGGTNNAIQNAFSTVANAEMNGANDSSIRQAVVLLNSAINQTSSATSGVGLNATKLAQSAASLAIASTPSASSEAFSAWLPWVLVPVESIIATFSTAATYAIYRRREEGQVLHMVARPKTEEEAE